MGDFVIVGGACGIGDHAVIGDGARIAGFSAVWGELEGGQDYGGIMARPAREWQREMMLLKKLAKERKRPKDE
jgi:UDP-3-O-[3-hydroxymyristoyl] glucosamine N-acyltransferase